MTDLALLAPNADGWVDARALYDELFAGVSHKTRYRDWIKRRLSSPQVNPQDFRITLKSEPNSKRGTSKRIYHHVRPFLAEHFAMMEDTATSHEVRNFFRDCRTATERMAIEIARLRQQAAEMERRLDAATKLKPKRLPDGRLMERYIELKESRDIFGEVTIERVVKKKYRAEMTKNELRLAKIQHMTRVQEGLAKALKETACADDIKPKPKSRATLKIV